MCTMTPPWSYVSVSTNCLPTSGDFSCCMYCSPHVDQRDVGLPQTYPMQPSQEAQEFLRNVVFLFCRRSMAPYLIFSSLTLPDPLSRPS